MTKLTVEFGTKVNGVTFSVITFRVIGVNEKAQRNNGNFWDDEIS